ncbi:hypothetical protein BDV25DRAFT_39163 [Aspergillus avenaceus]|uniref:Zn(2)-C6 fungal-type domain-containing protein n=1 Tax=Aspergillus avenaceus TaxID=36643 RepID=A0A5N6TLE5_ASPAV|nr:hypothetical protein BDV25DRAFT_39163 [Aspergillus avenaceus]
MSPQRSSSGKQRVRTGCWTCRRRRRKCDEGKPRCKNCESKGLSCKYGGDLTFVPVSTPLHSSTVTQRGNYRAIQFIEHDSELSTGIRASENVQDSQPATTPPVASRCVSADTDGADHPAFNPFGYSVCSTHDITRESTANPRNIGVHSVPKHDRYAVAKALVSPETISSNNPRAAGINTSHVTAPYPNDEIDLLRYFRYHLAPWIDGGDPECWFAIQTLLMAKVERALMAATLALALDRSPSPDISITNRVAMLQEEARRNFCRANDDTRFLGETLLMVKDFLRCRPREWRSVLRSRPQINRLPRHSSPEWHIYGQPWWLIHFRFDLAACILALDAPLLPCPTLSSPDGYETCFAALSSELRVAKGAYLRALTLLSRCLSLPSGRTEASSTTPSRQGQLPVHSLVQTDYTSEWTALWMETLGWYHSRPVGFKPIVEVKGWDADGMDPGNIGSFPILIYTTALALIANVTYHITCSLLLTKKPRLYQTLGGPSRFSSRIWHAQAIAGIAVSNDFQEQWDPILIAALLTIAPEMTHPSQQTALLDQLNRIVKATGIQLTGEIVDLQSRWDTSQYHMDGRD